jgi:hypothetical protein
MPRGSGEVPSCLCFGGLRLCIFELLQFTHSIFLQLEDHNVIINNQNLQLTAPEKARVSPIGSMKEESMPA